MENSAERDNFQYIFIQQIILALNSADRRRGKWEWLTQLTCLIDHQQMQAESLPY